MATNKELVAKNKEMRDAFRGVTQLRRDLQVEQGVSHNLRMEIVTLKAAVSKGRVSLATTETKYNNQILEIAKLKANLCKATKLATPTQADPAPPPPPALHELAGLRAEVSRLKRELAAK